MILHIDYRFKTKGNGYAICKITVLIFVYSDITHMNVHTASSAVIVLRRTRNHLDGLAKEIQMPPSPEVFNLNFQTIYQPKNTLNLKQP